MIFSGCEWTTMEEYASLSESLLENITITSLEREKIKTTDI